LIDHVIDGLKPQVETIVIVGRDWPGMRSVADRPAPDLGPLGGLCGALHLAKAGGFDAVLSAPCDTLPVPTDMPSFLPLSGGVIEGWPLLGLWPVALTSTLDLHLAGSGNRSMMGWIKQAGLAIIAPPCCLRNFNTPADLEGFELP
jgi:molybdenum cofactor guanylyltransferase